MRISLEDFSSVITVIHAAAASPERWPEALSAVARLVNALDASPAHGVERATPESERIDRRTQQAVQPSIQRLTALLTTHVEAAREIQSQLAGTLPGRLALASLDRLAVAAFILDAVGTVHYRNASARDLVEDDGGVRIINSRFRLKGPKLNMAFEAALRKATQDPPCSSFLPLRSSEEEIRELAISPLPTDHAHDSSGSVPLVLVTIATPQSDAPRIVQRVRPLYGLTEAEARVMAALTLGGTVDDIASAHGVRASTVRAQVRSIYEKTGVNRQSDLVRLALSGAPLIAGPDR